MDKKGNQISNEMMRKSIKSVAVEVAGLSKVKVCSDFFPTFSSSFVNDDLCVLFLLLKVPIEENDREGEVAVSFTPSQVGEHQVSVTFRGKHLQGSLFNLEVVDHPVYRRDYSKVVTDRE